MLACEAPSDHADDRRAVGDDPDDVGSATDLVRRSCRLFGPDLAVGLGNS
jgi:hypothetical protein